MGEIALKYSDPGNLFPARAVTELVESFAARMEYVAGEITLHRLPTPAEKDVLRERQRQVTALLRPADMAKAEHERARQAVSRLYGQYTNMRDPLETALGVADTMAKELPLWAIVKACDDVYHGRVYDEDRKTGARKYLSPDFPVTGVRLAQVAEGHCKALRDERVRIGNVLSCAKVRAEQLAARPERVVKPSLPPMYDGLEKHHQAQRAATREKLEEGAKRQREQALLMLYEQRGIAPKRTRAGEIIHPDLVDHVAWQEQETAREDDDNGDALHAREYRG